MNKIDILNNEYNELKNQYIVNNSINLKEDLKSKLIELDYEINREYEESVDKNFPMTTTIDKEEKRLENLIKYITEKQEEQKKLTEEYRKLTGKSIELSHIKHTDKLVEYNKRLDLVKSFLIIKKDLTAALSNVKEPDNTKIKVLKNRLMKKEMLTLLYEFCLIDSLDIKDIDVQKIIKEQEETKELPKEQPVKITKPKDDVKQEIFIEPSIVKQPQEIFEKKEEVVEENKILTTMPKLDKLGTVTPVSIFETIKEVEEKLPDVIIPTNGLTEESNEIFIETKNYFN